MDNIQEPSQTNSSNQETNDDKALAIFSYLWILWIAAYILYEKKKSEFNLFHLRQGLGLFIIWIINVILSNFLPAMLSLFIYLAIAVFEIIGIILAVKGEQKELPLIGKFINDNLKNFK
ncbi:MAG: hypothetical protein L3J74_02635 [Bacteroidales bacterium]|nr:hypothetical protein [Bacteroidales bacterium]